MLFICHLLDHPKLRAGQEAELCKIRRNDISLRRKRLHHAEEVRSAHAEPPSVVPHDRVNEQECLLSIKRIQEIEYFLDLPDV